MRTVVFISVFYCCFFTSCWVNADTPLTINIFGLKISLLDYLASLLIAKNTTTYTNWATDRVVPNLVKLVAEAPEDVVSIVNYAYSKGMHVRALGHMHTWSPLTVYDDTDAPNVILVDTTKHLKKITMVSRSEKSAIVKVECGATMESLLTFLEKEGYAFLATPAAGEITVGGALAIGGHGTSIPAAGEELQEGHTYGSISNLIVSFTAVVWSDTSSSYVLKTFERKDPEAKAFLTSLGKTFLTEVDFLVGPLFNLRCVSYVNIPSTEIFADPVTADEKTKTFASFLEASGRVETILFPFTDYPWLKVWTVSPKKPKSSVEVSSPYNYSFSDMIPGLVATLYTSIQKGLGVLTPLLGNVEYDIVKVGLGLSFKADIWGPAKNTLLYIRPSTLKLTENGYAIITTRNNIQFVLHTVYNKYALLVKEFQNDGEYPANGPLEIRVTGLDNPAVVGIRGAQSPSLSSIRPDDSNPLFDVAIWINILIIPKTNKSNKFLTIFQSFLLDNFNNGDGSAMIRPEWAKGWAYTHQGPYLNETVMQETIPNGFITKSSRDGWSWALSVFRKYDPGNVFSNVFLNKFFN